MTGVPAQLLAAQPHALEASLAQHTWAPGLRVAILLPLRGECIMCPLTGQH